uniref:PAZ domain-containing protein n=1 Tax=Bursaphelenchus xylophilus TaxID=6326 RepID=A0A1I7S0Y8_BURXY
MALAQIRSSVRKESIKEEVISNYYKLIWEDRPIYVYKFNARKADKTPLTNPFDLREKFYQFMQQHPQLRVAKVNRVVFDEQQYVYTLDPFGCDRFEFSIGKFKGKRTFPSFVFGLTCVLFFDFHRTVQSGLKIAQCGRRRGLRDLVVPYPL